MEFEDTNNSSSPNDDNHMTRASVMDGQPVYHLSLEYLLCGK